MTGRRSAGTVSGTSPASSRYFYYRELGRSDPYLLALFTSDIGVYSQYLEDHGIASLRRTESGWQGSPLAVEWAMDSAP
ncbi:hypothetical protein QFZ68_002692 [Streptomyces sp. V1I6]|nr:hypothetical protein [Streptomyces sp. V1I6]